MTTVVLVPGLTAKNWTLQPMRTRLEAEGYECHGAGFWTNTMVSGEFETLIKTLEKVGPAVIVGHSAGGLLASRAALERPDLVLAVIGLGSAVVGWMKCPVPWFECRSLEGALFPIFGPDEVKAFRGVFHALLPMSDSVQAWVCEKLRYLNEQRGG